MRKSMLNVCLFCVILFTLSGCTSRTEFTDTGEIIQGNPIFLTNNLSIECDSSFSNIILTETDYTLDTVNLCPFQYVVLVEDEYIPLMTYIHDFDVSELDLLESGIVFKHYNSSLYSILDIEMSDLELIQIILRESNGDIQGVELDPNGVDVPVEIAFSKIKLPIYTILSQELNNEEDICYGNVCEGYGSHPEITIELSDGSISFEIRLENHTTSIYIREIATENNRFYYMTSSTLSSEFEVLYQSIYTQYINSK